MKQYLAKRGLIARFNDLKFIRKIQLGFFFIAGISTLIAVNDFVQITSFETVKDSLFEDFISPKENISQIYTEFQKIQFIMLKFSIAEFEDNFDADMAEFEQRKKILDEKLLALREMKLDEGTMTSLESIAEIWSNYKNVVADAIISASVTRNFEFAAIIATTSGEEVGSQLVGEFDLIVETLDKKAAQIDVSVSEDVSNARIYITVGMALGAFAFFVCTLWLAPIITNPIKHLRNVVQDFSLGDYETEININSKDEIGELAGMMDKLKSAQLKKIDAAQKLAKGILEKVEPASEKDNLSHSFNEEIDIINELLTEAETLISASKDGDLSVRGNVDNFSGGWKRIIEGVNSMLDATNAPVSEAGQVLTSMAEGNFTVKMKGEYKGDYLNMKNNVNKVVASLNQAIGRVAQSASDLATSASQISSSTEEMAVGANEQSAQTTDVASAVEEMTATILESTKNASDAAAVAKEAGKNANDGGEIVLETIQGINRIAEVVVRSADTIKELGKSSNKIGEIIQVINDIADQTNLLAFNAAIEAARAGEQGRGFAVVADEVRKLAERTTKATKEIETMIKHIQEDTAGAVDAIEEGTREVEKGKALAEKAHDALEKIIENSSRVDDIINQLATSSEQQSTTSESISKSVETISNVTQQSAEGTHQISRAAEDLYRLTENLQEIIEYFQLDAIASEDDNVLSASEYSVRQNGKLIHS
ncbi:MAG: HAMP domain-containing protein [Bacteroidetes bacterium]|nr:HAMP domain-containing protein [Bacteroidota bacterium]